MYSEENLRCTPLYSSAKSSFSLCQGHYFEKYVNDMICLNVMKTFLMNKNEKVQSLDF